MFHQPQTLDEALELRGRLGEDARIICGGTDVVVALNHGAERPASFLDLSQVRDFGMIERENGWVYMGAGTTFSDVGRTDIRCLRDAAVSMGGTQVRNSGTIGGNLVTASPAGDGCVALLAIDAQVEITSAARGPRWVSLADEWFLEYRKTALRDDELVTRVKARTDFATAWYKIGKRQAVNISVACCAAGRSPDHQYYLAFGSVAFKPMRATKAEELLRGRELTPDSIKQAADQVMQEVSPIDDQRASADYRRAMCGVITQRVLGELSRG